MFFHIKITTKDKQILTDLNRLIRKSKMIIGFLNFFPKSNKRKFITVLKSPHVNKTAQEQFEYRFYTREFFISSFKPLTFFLILKKMSVSSLFGLDLRVESVLKKNKHDRLLAVDPDNFELGNVENHCNLEKFKDFQASKRYIQLFDCYGEMYLKHNF